MEKQIFIRHKNVIDQSRDILMKAHEIRASKEYKDAMQYFQLQKQRGKITESPSLTNGYKIEVK